MTPEYLVHKTFILYAKEQGPYHQPVTTMFELCMVFSKKIKINNLKPAAVS